MRKRPQIDHPHYRFGFAFHCLTVFIAGDGHLLAAKANCQPGRAALQIGSIDVGGIKRDNRRLYAFLGGDARPDDIDELVVNIIAK